ncbi:ABC1 kinase family protein [Streptomyces purpureus]|uniref:ABC1 kinase family protein n=1 Tax=Streptomyces purpureus TaxID=1951 RepID=UPI00035DF3E8|nr:AarF/UbiB family protein [Streptomyces purpureus]
MAAMVGDRLRLVVKVLGGLAADEVGRAARDRRRPVNRTPYPEEELSSGHEQRRARALRRALESLGPFYVKLGQILSTRPDMVSPTVIAELQNLHDQVDVQPFTVFEPVLARDLGPDWKYRFDDVETTEPLGAASLAQVYRVTLSDGRPAVVKIQRPGIRETVLADMALMRKAARLLARTAPRFNEVIDGEAMLGSIFDAMEPELDFTGEARNMEEAAENIRPYSTLAVPDVLLATPRVLVQSLAPGTSVRHVDRGRFSDQERDAIGKDLLRFMYRGYFVDRMFHADPHAGNVFAQPGGPATLIDWGMVGRLDRRTSLHLLPLLMAVAQNDGHGLARAWAEMGRLTPWSNLPAFASDMAALVPKISGASLDELDFGVSLTKVLERASKRGIGSAPSISLLGKSFANLEGSVRCLAPEIALAPVFKKEVRSILTSLAGEFFAPEQLARAAMDFMVTASTGPEQLRGLLNDAASRQLGLQVHQPRTPAALGGRHPAQPSWPLLALGAAAVFLDHRRRSR